MPEHPDITRLREEYAGRSTRLAHSDLYSVFNPAYLFAVQQRQRLLLRLLAKAGLHSLAEKKILEVGCGSGGVLAEYLLLGAQPGNMFGVDLLPVRLAEARQRLPGSGMYCADGQDLPFPAQYFDLVLQYTAFSSILDMKIRTNIAREMQRVLRPGGIILWYDFWLNPTNPQTKGIRPAEIRQLFPDCQYTFQRITLAPPLARRIIPLSWGLGLLLEGLRFLNTHYLAVIRCPQHRPQA